jgi:hypothetical protein
MKKTIFILSFLISYAGIAFSQEYHPLLENPSWIAYRYYSGQAAASPNYLINQPEAVEIGTVTYKRFIDSFVTGYAEYVYLREDIAQKKVYSLINGSEKLIYDFSLENGDTFIQDQQTYTAAVNDTVVAGVTRKKINVQLINTTNSSFRQIWIEGIGGTAHPLRPYYNVQSYLTNRRNWTHLKCAFQGSEHIYGLANCSSLLATDAPDIDSAEISFYPNPIHSEMNIRYDKGFQNLTVTIFNSIGQLVRKVNDQKGQQITVGLNELPSGFYTVQLLDEGQMLKTKKVIVE